MIGRSLGPYKVTEQLGAGGMGEVYLAEDTRLGRRVAIKVLPANSVTDPERLARFEQEARAAAALNHPHIAAVYDVGVQEAGDHGDAESPAGTPVDASAPETISAPVHYMVQEYLEGDTLRAPLARGALSLNEALDLAVEVAEGLVAAHAAGMVHRDLKPENVFVTQDGHAKILDFGLAKLTEAPGAGTDSQSQSPTALGTVAGQVMGTVGYMAPEQVDAAADVDARADLFAFGALLYEMATGKRAFAGESIIDTLHAITKVDPEPIGDTDPSLPGELQRILRKALAKDRGRRYQHADELAVDLRQLRDDVVAGAASPAGSTRQEPVSGAAPLTHGSRAALAVTAVVAAGVVLLLALALIFWGANSQNRRLDFYASVEEIVPESFQPVAISPDGSTIAIATEGRLRYRRLDENRWVDAAAAPSGVVLFSPTGEHIYFTRRGGVWTVGLDGGPEQLVADTGLAQIGSAWWESPEVLMLYGTDFGTGDSGRGVMLRFLPASGDDPTEIWSTPVARDAPAGLMPVGSIGDGRFLAVRLSANGTTETGVLDLEAGPVGQWRQGFAGGRVLGGRILVVDAQGRLVSTGIAEDGLSLSTTGDLLAEGLLAVGGFFDVAADGTAVFISGGLTSLQPGLGLLWLDRQGNTESVAGERGEFDVDTRLSPDGRYIALEAPFEGRLSTWIRDLERGVATPLTVAYSATFPVWSPDGSEIVFRVRRPEDGQTGIYRAPVDRSSSPELLLPDPAEGEYVLPMDWSPDGATLLYLRSQHPTRRSGSDIWMLPLEGDDAIPVVTTAAHEVDARFSSDGAWIAYVSDYTGRPEVYVRPMSGGGEVVVSSGGGQQPEWHPGRSTLFFLGTTSEAGESAPVLAADVGDGGSVSPVREVVRLPRFHSNLFIVGRDGERFMTTTQLPDIQSPRLRVIVNPAGR